jgi:hypothetical protein
MPLSAKHKKSGSVLKTEPDFISAVPDQPAEGTAAQSMFYRSGPAISAIRRQVSA